MRLRQARRRPSVNPSTKASAAESSAFLDAMRVAAPRIAAEIIDRRRRPCSRDMAGQAARRMAIGTTERLRPSALRYPTSTAI